MAAACRAYPSATNPPPCTLSPRLHSFEVGQKKNNIKSNEGASLTICWKALSLIILA